MWFLVFSQGEAAANICRTPPGAFSLEGTVCPLTSGVGMFTRHSVHNAVL